MHRNARRSAGFYVLAGVAAALLPPPAHAQPIEPPSAGAPGQDAGAPLQIRAQDAGAPPQAGALQGQDAGVPSPVGEAPAQGVVASGSDAGASAEANRRDASVPAPDGAAPHGLQPPELLEPAESSYPAQAAAARLEATVIVRLTIDVDGRVTDAEVPQPVGYGFDEAAREAALRLHFRPARRDGQPIPARIALPIEFKLPADPSPPSPPPPPAAPPSPVEVEVAGSQTEVQRLQRSAEAVSVIDLHKAKEQTVDLGEVLARTQGVSIRRSGGLGSFTRFSLNGLYDDQIRFFLDGIPLELAGYPFGISEVPVNLIDRVEVFRGVVPIRFGADALGGAVNLATDPSYATRAGASYQVGSFGTHRVTADGHYRHDPTGIVLGGAGFFDLTENNYDVNVSIPDARGRLQPATVPRFHDGYRAYGAALEAGVIDRPWAKRLLLRGFLSGYDKELQHNVVMTVPYGGVESDETVYGATARYEVALGRRVELELVGSYTHRIIDYVDKSRWVYDWNGDRIRERRVRGEIGTRPHDQTEWQDSAFGRALAQWRIAPEHTLRASLTPTFTTRTGDERLQTDPDARDPLSAERKLLTFVAGLEYELSLLDDRLSNIVFVKDYVYDVNSEEPLPGNLFRQRDTSRHSQGAGDSLRFRFAPWLFAKASYEYATRLPRPDEVFGNGVLVLANLELQPEVSHNLNFGPRLELMRTPLGDFSFDLNAFLRDSDRLIVLLGNDRNYTYQNVYRARGLGIESALNWASPGRYLNLDGMLTWQDVRNASNQGTFGDFNGDRIPNRPYLFASWGARLRFAGLPSSRDTIEPFYVGRYVHGFFRGWESQGLREFKQTVDAQVLHSAGVSWIVSRDALRLVSTFEIDNLSDAKAFDNFGVQRPGRAFYVKLSGELR